MGRMSCAVLYILNSCSPQTAAISVYTVGISRGANHWEKCDYSARFQVCPYIHQKYYWGENMSPPKEVPIYDGRVSVYSST